MNDIYNSIQDQTLKSVIKSVDIPYSYVPRYATEKIFIPTYEHAFKNGPYSTKFPIFTDDNKTYYTEYISLKDEVMKNSDGGFYVTLKLDTDLSVGSVFKSGDIIAYNRASYSNKNGETDNLAYNLGVLAKVAILNTDEGFEDSAAITEEFSKKLATDVIIPEDITLDKNANIVVYKKIGDHVMEGESIMAYTTGYEDDEVSNALMKNFNFNQDQISELGRKPVVSDHTGILTGIEIIRTVDLDELSPSLKAFVLEHERPIKRKLC